MFCCCVQHACYIYPCMHLPLNAVLFFLTILWNPQQLSACTMIPQLSKIPSRRACGLSWCWTFLRRRYRTYVPECSTQQPSFERDWVMRCIVRVVDTALCVESSGPEWWALGSATPESRHSTTSFRPLESVSQVHGVVMLSCGREEEPCLPDV